MFTAEQSLETGFEHCRLVRHREKPASRRTALGPRFGNSTHVHKCTDARKTPESASPRLILAVGQRSFRESEVARQVVSASADRVNCVPARASQGTHETGHPKMRQIRPLMFIVSDEATFLSIQPLESATLI
jgi:hypothetical protein